METDPVDYPDLLQVPICTTAPLGGNNSNTSSGKGRKHPFLQRSDSTLCLGCPSLDPFDTVMSEALPLADQPHLLQPHSRREDLFGVPRQSNFGASGQSTLEGLPSKLGLSGRNTENQINSSTLMLGHTTDQVNRSQNSNLEGKRQVPQVPCEAGPSKIIVILFYYLKS